MRYDYMNDRKLVLLIVFLLISIVLIGIIWRHYDKELDAIERHKNEIKVKAE